MHKEKRKAKMCQEIQVKTSQIKAWGDPSSKAEFQPSKTLWRSKQTPILELPKPGETLLSSLTEKAAQKWAGAPEERKFWNAGTGIKHSNPRGSCPHWEVTQDKVRAAFQRNPERQLESDQHRPPNLLLPLQGVVSELFLAQSLIPGTCCPRNDSQGSIY